MEAMTVLKEESVGSNLIDDTERGSPLKSVSGIQLFPPSVV